MALIQPKEMVAQAGSKAILYVGPNVHYRSKHIPGSVFAGPGSNAAGLALLKQEAGKLARRSRNRRLLRLLSLGPLPLTCSRPWICSKAWDSRR